VRQHGVSKDGPKQCDLWPSFETRAKSELLRTRSHLGHGL
jgi:hypothetical protein